jgi:hypothetical protein
MSVDMCERLNAWVPKRVIINVMGGEFTILKNYPEMLIALVRGRSVVRLVTNGYWAGRNTGKFFDAIRSIKNTTCKRIDVAVSSDYWHEKQSHHAILLLKNNDLGVDLIEFKNLNIKDIIPVGRAWDNNIRHNKTVINSCTKMCNMTVTEDGMLCRCPHGYFPWKHFRETTWYDAQEYIWGWRAEKLTEGMHCQLCMKVDSTKPVLSIKEQVCV